MEISWAERVGDEEVLQRVKEEKNILPTVNRKKTNWICHILRRDCFLKHVVEGELGVIRRRRCKQLLDHVKEVIRYSELRYEERDCILWRTRVERVYESVVTYNMRLNIKIRGQG